jgi:hypothetical protein
MWEDKEIEKEVVEKIQYNIKQVFRIRRQTFSLVHEPIFNYAFAEEFLLSLC